MKEVPFKAIRVTDSVWWVGAIDRTIRDFHGYGTPSGTTYNAYLIMADKVTLIDTVKKPFMDELLSRISSIVDPSRIDYIVSNHAEMDHSGSLPAVISRVNPEKVFASTMGVETLKAQLSFDRELTAVKSGETLNLGNKTLSFLETRMIHWPDSMFTYMPDDKILFSQDAFGMHLASYERFDDEIPKDTLEWEAAKYYGNIVMPFSPLVLKLLEKVASMNIEIDIIAPDHGPIWRKQLGWILGLYKRWALQEPTTRAVVLFDSMWGSTTMMARSIGEGIKAGGASPRLIPMGSSDRAEVATEVLKSGALIAGSPTMNREVFPTMADVMTYLRGLKPANLIGAAFGSYGWSGEGHRYMKDMLEAMNVEIVSDTHAVKFVPNRENLNACFEFGMDVAKQLLERCNECNR
ncbi:MAG TPA: FprA family A-type flavoprotein [Caldisericia bacterium]|nr:FprA family A-type flavoprotein [Caldisericia bacterium]HPF49683.1 FprA family A-type flavoprotein [Caldisericia bacterium]HPI84544.1 FprA family A-type flavoprotein [Caldisericia bacterium]HPQ93659.1 FprA family A-type flavoprotein [Caldisericia bacterium]HRV74777.1 FprA family A-type flavoprotein [Caldisericia bacterium]